MAEAIFVIAGLAFIVAIVALYMVVGSLNARVQSRILGRAVRSMNRVPLIAKLTGAPEPAPRHGLDAMFDVMEGRENADSAEPPRRTAAGRTSAGTAIENLGDRDPK